MSILTVREVVRGGLATLLLAILAGIGQWLAMYAPEYLAAFRFVNGLVITTGVAILLWKCAMTQDNLRIHRQEIKAMIADLASQHTTEVLALSEKAATLALRLSQHHDEVTALRHDVNAGPRATDADSQKRIDGALNAASQRLDKTETVLLEAIHEGTKHAEAAYHEANNANVKLKEVREDLQKQLGEKKDK